MIRRVMGLILFFCLTVFAHESFSQGHWIASDSPVNHKLRRLHFVDNSTGWAAGDSGVIIHTRNGGETWERQVTGITHNILDVFFLNRDMGWALAWDFDRTIILRTFDGGATWEGQDYQEPFKYMRKIHFLDSLNGIMGGNPNAFVYTDNGGAEWFPVTVDSGALANFPVLYLNFFDHNLGFAVGGKFDLSGVVWKTTNGGKNWVSKAVAPEPIQHIIFLDSLNIIGVGGDFEFFGAGVIRSQDAGVTWEYNSVGVAGVAYAVSFRTPSEAWACLGSARKFITTPGKGKSWRSIATPNNSSIYDIVFIDSLNGFAVGDSGVIYRYSPTVVSIREDRPPEISQPYSLMQNYPNPFNAVTTIRFRILTGSGENLAPLSLKVYDIQGREVATLVEGKKSPGQYSVQWDAGGQSSGIYYCRLQSGKYSEVRKMILLK